MADAANALAALRNDRRLRPAIPVREIVLVVISALLLTTLAFLRGLGGALPELAVARVPPFTPAIERPAEPEPSQAEVEAAQNPPTVQQVLERSDRSSQARRDLQSLAAALADHALTRPAAEQIARGNYEDAANQLRDAATEAGELSPSARQELAGDLQQAANTMEPKTNGLQEATQDAAAGMQKDDQAASAGMRELGDAVQRAGQQVVPQGELAAQMRTARQAAAQRGDNSGDSAPPRAQTDATDASSQPSASGDPGKGADANASSGSDGDKQSGSRDASAGNNSGDPRSGQSGQRGERGQGNAEGAANQPGAGENGRPGQVSQGSQSPGMEGNTDAARAQQGAGAGTGESDQQGADQAASSSSQLQVGAGDPAAAPEVSNGNGAEAEPGRSRDAHDQVALPVGSGNEGIQTSPNGGSALRGSGAGVTAGSGYAVQGDVGEAGPDSNRVPPQHRETVERYFSNGSDRMSTPGGWFGTARWRGWRSSRAGASTAVDAAARMTTSSCSMKLTLARLRRLSLLSGRARTEGLAGEHRSRRRGTSPEFADFKRYSQGDDFRRIDWNTYARLDGLFVRLSEVTTELSVHILLDSSASMDWSGEAQRLTKFTAARRLTGALAYVALWGFDRVTITPFSTTLGFPVWTSAGTHAGGTGIALPAAVATARGHHAGTGGRRLCVWEKAARLAPPDLGFPGGRDRCAAGRAARSPRSGLADGRAARGG